MATPSTKTANPTDLTNMAEKFREQLVSSVQQGQKMSIDAAQTWVKAVSVLPVPELPAIPGLPALPGLEAVTKYTFDVAADLLNAQRDFALQLTNVLIPAAKN
ncbi:MAG: hypothetical protein ABI903_00405 [Actinomycetota bacterium]